MPRPSSALAAAPPMLVLLLLLTLLLVATTPAHAGQGLLPPSYPVTVGKVWDPTYTGPARANASKQLINEWTCRGEPKCSSHYCGLPFVLSNSQGYFRCDPANRVGRPTSLAQLRAQVLSFTRVKANGVGHSWDAGQFCAGPGSSSLGLVLTEFPEVLKLATTPPKQYRLTGCDPATARPFGGEVGQDPVVVDPVARTVRVHAGVGTRMLLDYLAACPTKGKVDGVPNGWTLPAYPWYVDQTIGGAVATATHGSSFTYGSLSNQVVALTLMTADGEELHLSADDPDGGHLFRAARASVGRLGVLTSLTFNILPQVPVERTKRRMTLAQMAAEVTAVQDAYNAAVSGGGSPSDIAAALAPLDATQFFFFAKTDEAWRFDFRTLGPAEDAKAQSLVDGAAEAAAAVEEQGAFLMGAVSALLAKAGKDGKNLFDVMAGKLDGKARSDPDVDKKAGLVPSKPVDMEKLEPHKGVPDPGAAAKTHAVALKIDAATHLGNNATLAGEGVYAQYDKSVALPPNAYWVADLFNSTFDAVMRGIQGNNLPPGVFGSRKAYPSQACAQSVVLADSNAYDQYEAAIPMAKAGTCLTAMVDLLNGPAAARLGFRTTPLVRFVGADDAYISPTAGGPRMFLNLEDHLSYNTGPGTGSPADAAQAQNPGFWAVMELLVHGPACGGRLHWGKAGWPTLLGPTWSGTDPVTGYPDTWCDFGCAVETLDPTGKFRTSSPVWRWAFEASGGGSATPADCCGPSGFNATACTCGVAPTPPPPCVDC